MSYPYVCNAEVEGVEIRFDRGFILSAWISLNWDGGAQAFGGYALGGSPFDSKSKVAEHGKQANISADFIGGCMAVAGVEKWSAIKGKVIRIGKQDEFGPIVAIGHPTKNIWYDPAKRFGALRQKNTNV